VDVDVDVDVDADVRVRVPSSIEERGDIGHEIEDGIKFESPWIFSSIWYPPVSGHLDSLVVVPSGRSGVRSGFHTV